MIAIYFILAILIALAIFFNKNNTLKFILLGSFVILQFTFTIYEYLHLGQVDLMFFTPDALGIIFLFVLSIICIPAFYHSYLYFGKQFTQIDKKGMYYSAMIILITALSGAYLSNQIAITWVFIELTTLSASALIYHRRTEISLEGTWKYLFVCSISITLVFIGILFLTMAIGKEEGKDLSYVALLAKAPELNVFWLKLAFLFIFTGFTSKAGLVPMYTAGIDAKDAAPHPVGALFGSVLMNVGFLGIFRFYEIVSHTEILNWSNNIIIISGLLSVFVSTVYMLKVNNLKRLMAYSGVEHMGLVVLGLAAGGIGRYAAILHLILHSFAKSSLFFQFGQIYRTFKSKSINNIGNYFKYNTTGAIVLLLLFFTVTAMPPSGLFISEFMIFRAMFEAHQIWLLAIILILLTLIIWSLAKNIFKMLFIKPDGFDDSNLAKINPGESISQFIFIGLVIYLGFNPPAEMVNLINAAIENFPK
jgi:hydrogenase-4 component F